MPLSSDHMLVYAESTDVGADDNLIIAAYMHVPLPTVLTTDPLENALIRSLFLDYPPYTRRVLNMSLRSHIIPTYRQAGH